MADQKIEENSVASPQLSSEYWLNEIRTAEKNLQKWHNSADKIVRRFLDRRDAVEEGMNKINLFTTNTMILMSTLYAKFPKPVVTREFEDPNDDVARVAAEIMERCLKIRPRDCFDAAMHHVVQDRLVPGAGTMWLRYEPTFEKRVAPAVTDPMTGVETIPAKEYEVVTAEKVVEDYVYWRDIVWSPARTWETVRWVARRVRMTKEDATKRFGEMVAGQLTYVKEGQPSEGAPGSNYAGSEAPDHDNLETAVIYEIWCKTTRKVHWVSTGFGFILDEKPDPLRLSKFYPTPRFLMALNSTSNFMPRPDYLLAQDQYQELDMVNNRITWLERAVKVIGVFDGNNAEIERIFTEGVDNKIIPMRSFKEFMEKGGFKGSIDWIPLDQIVGALEKLRTYRQDLISQIYELTGISDIMRGASKASETLGAQQLKAQYGSVKLQFLQMEVAGFVEEALQIKSEIIRNFFSDENIVKTANVGFMYDQELIGQALELVKSPDFEFRVEVQADSMAVPEFNAERDGRMNFIRAVAEMMTTIEPLAEKSPEAGVAMLEIIKWGAGSFRSGRQVEGIIDNAVKAITKKLMTPQPPPEPNPKDVAAANASNAKAEKDKADTVFRIFEGVQQFGPGVAMALPQVPNPQVAAIAPSIPPAPEPASDAPPV
jgi:hypothetical protein